MTKTIDLRHEAECKLLALMIFDPARVSIALNAGPPTFTSLPNELIWATLLYLNALDRLVDVISIGETMKRHQSFEAAGGAEYIVEVMQSASATDEMQPLLDILYGLSA